MAQRIKGSGRNSAVLRPPHPSRQIGFYQILLAARKKWFIDALREAVSRINPSKLKAEASEFIPQQSQKVLAVAGIRDEEVFPLPSVLEERPSLVGYYRLLLGAGKAKSFYKMGTGLAQFRTMEEKAVIGAHQRENLPAFCRAMAKSLSELVKQIPELTERDIRELPLLTFGAQLQGFNNTEIGKRAVQDIFLLVAEILKPHIKKRTDRALTVLNAAKRNVVIRTGLDPDISIQETVGDQVHSRVAIEIKGGADISNVHNRADEAEKSHTKARKKGYRDFWTVISQRGVKINQLRAESITTTLWFDLAELLARKGRDWSEFKERLCAEVGIPLTEPQSKKPKASHTSGRAPHRDH